MITRRSFIKWAAALGITAALTDPLELLEGLTEEPVRSTVVYDAHELFPEIGVDLASGPDFMQLVAGEDIQEGDLVITEQHGQGMAYRMRSYAALQEGLMMAIGGAVTSAREGQVVTVVSRFSNSLDPVPGQITFNIPWDHPDADPIADIRRVLRS